MDVNLGVCPRVLLSQIVYDDARHLLVFNQRMVPLSPTEYALATALLRQRQRWQEAEGQAAFCLSVTHLMQVIGIRSRETLLRHLSNTTMKLLPSGIYLVNARSYGYLILFASEIAEVGQ